MFDCLKDLQPVSADFWYSAIEDQKSRDCGSFYEKNNGVTRILWRMVSWDKDREVLFASLSEFFVNGVCRKTYYAHPNVLESFIVW
jgi:hypothetical protein